jgi:hypothetical protein
VSFSSFGPAVGAAWVSAAHGVKLAGGIGGVGDFGDVADHGCQSVGGGGLVGVAADADGRSDGGSGAEPSHVGDGGSDVHRDYACHFLGFPPYEACVFRCWMQQLSTDVCYLRLGVIQLCQIAWL